jgi:hypothetical protein
LSPDEEVPVTKTTGPPDWLRPIDERFLAGDPGPAPRTVNASAGASALCAVAALGMMVMWGRMALRQGGSENYLLALSGAVLLVIFASATVMLHRRGWFRLPLAAAIYLGVLAAVAVYVLVGPRRVGGGLPDFAEPRIIATGIVSFGLAILLRTPSASTWLAKRRYQVSQRGNGSTTLAGGDARPV